MGRRKIEIKRLENSRNRKQTFKKRRQGILKKAHELAVLTDSRVKLTIENGDVVEDHVFNDKPQPPRSNAAPVSPNPLAQSTINAIVDPPPMDDGAVEDAIVVRTTPEQMPTWSYSPLHSSYDFQMDPLFGPLALTTSNAFSGFDIDLYPPSSGLGVPGLPFPEVQHNNSAPSTENYNDCNWLFPMLEWNPDPQTG